ADSNDDIAAVNSRAELAGVSGIMQRRIHGIHMDEGVTIVNPGLTQIDWGVTIGLDTVIHPGTVIQSDVKIGKECIIGPYAYLPKGTVVKDGHKVGPMWEETAMD
ncbi:MAG: UDP-N-acetylglucosamine pyrophosphorylase, partial [Phycisphaerae bacterium]|nr:UDP-N-acetylglucosamine pyrophosphorylase [Phycisphaerae bacterium]